MAQLFFLEYSMKQSTILVSMAWTLKYPRSLIIGFWKLVLQSFMYVHVYTKKQTVTASDDFGHSHFKDLTVHFSSNNIQ